MNIVDFVKAAKELTTTKEVIALVDQFIAANALIELASLRQSLEELVGKPIISDDRTYLSLMGLLVGLSKDVPIIKIPDDKGLGNVQFPLRRMKSMNTDFEGIMPGVDQMLYDQANAKALAQAASAIDPTGMHPLSQELLPPELATLGPDEIANYINTALAGSYDSRPQHKFKLTDRHGDRGVICTVLPDDQMPLDKEGNRAEIVINDSPVL